MVRINILGRRSMQVQFEKYSVQADNLSQEAMIQPSGQFRTFVAGSQPHHIFHQCTARNISNKLLIY